MEAVGVLFVDLREALFVRLFLLLSYTLQTLASHCLKNCAQIEHYENFE